MVPHPYLGFKVESKLSEIRETNRFSTQDEEQFRDKCVKFTVELIKQLKQRLPENYNVLKKVNQLSVSNTLKQVKERITSLVREMGHSEDFIAKVETQCVNISLVPWEKKDNTISFWSEVLKYQDAAGNNPFIELCSFALLMISLPWSNGEVERVFSQLNIVKNKARNRLHNTATNAIITIRAGLRRQKNAVTTTYCQLRY